MTTAECDRFYKWEPGLASFTTIFAEAWVFRITLSDNLIFIPKMRPISFRILVVRTYALWGKNKYILAILLTGLTSECVVLFFAVTRFQAVPTRDPTDPNSRGACIAGGGPGGHDWSMVKAAEPLSCRDSPRLTHWQSFVAFPQAYWVSPIVMDTLMLALTSIRVSHSSQNNHVVWIIEYVSWRCFSRYRLFSTATKESTAVFSTHSSKMVS